MTSIHPLIVAVKTTFNDYIAAYDSYTDALEQLEAHQKYNASLEAAAVTWETAVENACLAFQNAVDAAIAAGLVPESVVADWGSGNFSFDEFRYWKKARSHKEIRRNWFSQVGGGSNEMDISVRDRANSDLGVYYKFNEGVLDDKCVSKGGFTCQDANVIDYSGRASNGNIVNYNEEVRSTKSALDESGLITSPESKDPILYPNHPDVVSLLEEKKNIGRVWDLQNNASIFNSIPHWMTEEDNGNLLQLSQIVSSYFDQLHLQIQELPRLKDMVYDDPEMQEIPYPFSKDLLLSMGFSTPDIFVDATVLEEIASRDEERVFEKDIQVIKNLIYQNIYNNLVYIYKTKGTEKSFENLIRCFGVDDELIKLNLYADNVTYKLEDNRKFTSVKKNYVDFFKKENNESTVYQIDDEENVNSQTYIEGCPTGVDYKFVPTTFEMEVLLPKLVPVDHPDYVKPDFGYPQASMPHSSVAGFYPVNSVGQILSEGVELFTQRRSVSSSDVRFVIKVGFGINQILVTDYFKESYNNEKWNLAVRVRPEDKYWQDGDMLVDLVSSASDIKYVLEVYGVNTTLDVVEEEFTLKSSPFDFALFQGYMESNKRIYLGARRSGFDSLNVLNKSDVRITDVRYWFDYLDNETVQLHAYDAKSFGRKRPYQPAYFSQTSFVDASGGIHIPQIKTLALHWDFSTVQKSGPGIPNNPTTNDATFFAHDLSSGSIEQSSKWGWLGNIIEKNYPAQGDYFEPNDTQVVDREYAYSAKTKLPETLNSSDMIDIANRDDDVFTKGARPVTHFWAVEKSMYQTVSEEMINMFASIQDFNNLIGEPVHRYRMEYKDLGKLRELFFNKVENTPDLDKYVDFYKWLDSSLNEMLQQLIPASANFSSSMRTVVESHVLERNKYWSKFPTLEMKDSPIEGNIRGIRELTYDWNSGHKGPSSTEDSNCDWWKERAERDVPTSGDSDLDETREQIRQSIVRDIKGQTELIEVGGVKIESGKRLLNNSSGTLYEGSTYATRRLSKPYKHSVALVEPITGGSNSPSKKRQVEFLRSVVPFGSTGGLKIGEQLQSPSCTDDMLLKQKILTDSTVGLLNTPEGSYLNKMWGTIGAFYSEYTKPEGPVVITNRTDDSYGDDKEVPMQGPFTEAHVGGSQHRHVHINFSATDDQLSRPELYLYDISRTAYVTPDSIDINNPRAGFFRGETAKRPVNIRNISSWSNLDKNNILNSEAEPTLGNYRFGYEVVQTSGRGLQNRYLVKNQGISLLLDDHSAGDHAVVDLYDFRLPDRSKVHRWGTPGNFVDEWVGDSLPQQNKAFGQTQHVIVERFSAPGSPDTNARGAFDVETEEFTPYNSLNYRNFLVRWHLNHWHHDHMRQFGGFRHLYIHNGFDPCCGVIDLDCDDTGKVPGSNFGFVDGKYQKVAGDFCVASWHKVNRNARHRFLEDSLNQGTYTCETVYDNWFVQHQIPQSDWQYSWIASNTSERFCSLHGYIGEFPNISNSTKKPLLDDSGLPVKDERGRPVFLDTHTYEEFSREPEDKTYTKSYTGIGGLYEKNTAITVDYDVGTGLMFGVDESVNYIGRENYDDYGPELLNNLLNHRGGGYASSTWKSIRGYENIVSRKHRNNNIISVSNPLRASAPDTDDPLYPRPATVDNTKCSRYREPAIGWNMPMKTGLNPASSVRGVRLKHTYSNNLEGFANPHLTNRLGYVKCKGQLYDLLVEQYRDSEVEPSPKFVSLEYKEYIFPKHRYVGLKETRERLHYFETDLEKTLYRAGDLRTFWKDDRNQRKRFFTSRSALGYNSYMSINQHNLFRQYDSLWGMDDWKFLARENEFDETGKRNEWSVLGELAYVGDKRYHAWISSHEDSYYLGHLDSYPAGAKELKRQEKELSQAEKLKQKVTDTQRKDSSSTRPSTAGSEYISEIRTELVSELIDAAKSAQTELAPGIFVDATVLEEYTPILPNYKLPTESPRPQMQFFYQPYTPENKYREEGWSWNTGLMSGLSPWYDDYQQYSFNDIRLQGQNYGLVPEYRVSEHMEFYVNDNGGNFRARNKNFLTLEGASFDKVSYLSSGDAKRQEERVYTHDTGATTISENEEVYYPFKKAENLESNFSALMPSYLWYNTNEALANFIKDKFVGKNYATQDGSADNRPVYFVDLNKSVITSQLDTPWLTDVTGSSEGDTFNYPISYPDAVIGLNLGEDEAENILTPNHNDSRFNSQKSTETIEVPINSTKIETISGRNKHARLYIGDPNSIPEMKSNSTPWAISLWFNASNRAQGQYGLFSVGGAGEKVTTSAAFGTETYATIGFNLGLAVVKLPDGQYSLVYYDNVPHKTANNIYSHYEMDSKQQVRPSQPGRVVFKESGIEYSYNVWSVRTSGQQAYEPLKNSWNHVVLQYVPPTTSSYAFVRVFVNGVLKELRHYDYLDHPSHTLAALGQHVTTPNDSTYEIMGAAHNGQAGIVRQLTIGSATLKSFDETQNLKTMPFHGYMSDASLFTGVLSQNDVKELYNVDLLGQRGTPNNIVDLVNSTSFGKLETIQSWSKDLDLQRSIHPALPPVKLPTPATPDSLHYSGAQAKDKSIRTSGIPLTSAADSSLVSNKWLDGSLFGAIGWWRLGVPYIYERIGEASGWNEDFFKVYSHTDFIKNFDLVIEDHEDLLQDTPPKLSLKANVIKKLLPYNGFYPMTRTIQLGGLFVDCWGGKVTSDCGFHHEQVVQSLIQPFFAPGILFNSVKSGIAVDWAAFNNASGEEVCKAEPLATATVRLANALNVLPDTRPQGRPSEYTSDELEHPSCEETMTTPWNNIWRERLGVKPSDGEEYRENWAEYWGDGWLQGMETLYYPNGIILDDGHEEHDIVEFQFHTKKSKEMKGCSTLSSHRPWYPYDPTDPSYVYAGTRAYNGTAAESSYPAIPIAGIVNGQSDHADWIKFWEQHNTYLIPINKNVDGSDYDKVPMGYKKSTYQNPLSLPTGLEKRWLPFPILGGGHDLYEGFTAEAIRLNNPTHYKDGVNVTSWKDSSEIPIALVFLTGENTPEATTEPWEHIRLLNLVGVSGDLKVGDLLPIENVGERAIDTKKNVPGFWVNKGSKKIYSLVQISDTQLEVQETYNPFNEPWIVINSGFGELSPSSTPDFGWRWETRPDLYEIIENGAEKSWKEGYYDATTGEMATTPTSLSVISKRIVFVDLDDGFGNVLSEQQIMKNFASQVNKLNKEGSFDIIANAEREDSGAAICYLTNLNKEQALTPTPVHMVDNRPETTDSGLPIVHTVDYEFSVHEAFSVNGFIEGERYTPTFYEWDNQPKNSTSSRFPLAKNGTEIFISQVEDNDAVSSNNGMIITREPDLRIPFEGILHPESVFPPSGSMEATQEMRNEERVTRGSEARVLIKYPFALNGTSIVLTDPYGNEQTISIGHKSSVSNFESYRKPLSDSYEQYFVSSVNADGVPEPAGSEAANVYFNFDSSLPAGISVMNSASALNVLKYYINNHLKSFDENGEELPSSLWEAHILSGNAADSHEDFWLDMMCWWDSYQNARPSLAGDFIETTTKRYPPGYYLRIVYKGDRSNECQISATASSDFSLYGNFGGLSEAIQSKKTGLSFGTGTGQFVSDRLIDGEWTINSFDGAFFGGKEVVYDAIAGSTIHEKPSQIYFLAPEYYTGSLDSFKEWARYPYFEWTGESVTPLYSMAMHNFLAEIPNFFLKDNKFTTFASKPESEFKEMEAGKTYFMDVVLQQSQGEEDTVSGFSMTLSPNNGFKCGSIKFLSDDLTTNGRYFGPAFQYKDAGEYSGSDMIADPAQAPYTPPYFYGRATARLSFKCEETRRYTVEEILNGVEVVNLNRDATNKFLNVGGTIQSPAFSSMMTISSSVNLFGKTRDRVITHDLTNKINEESNFLPVQARTPENSNYDRWVISPKFETPVLNFKDADHYNVLECSREDSVDDPSFGRGTGMWAGYGKLPSVDEGVFISLEESFKQRKDWKTPLFESSGSLADVCGFQTQQSRIGDLADQKEISEALVMIPFVDQPSSRGAKTISIGERNFFKITKKLFNLTKQNISLGDTAQAIKPGEYNSENGVQETSISRMIKLMQNYNIPPQFDFVTYPPSSGEFPFVMYIHEFHHVLDKDDLSNIWQGVMPKIARTSEKDTSVITHDLGPVDFFEGKKMPQGIRWMVFKVKKKAETNYWKKTADSSDDDRFRFDFSVGKKTPEYSYNWPYDFFSLVELVQVEGGTHILAQDVHKTTEKPLIRMEDDRIEETIASSQKAVEDGKKIKKGIFGWDK